MPKKSLYFDSNVVKLSPEEWKELGRQLAVPLAQAMSTKEHRLIPSTDIDFLPIPYPPGYIGHKVAIEIETIGYPERKAKFTAVAAQNLKDEFLRILAANGINFDAKNHLIWVKYVDPDGPHV